MGIHEEAKTASSTGGEACDGTGLQPVKQPDEPGRRIYPPPCKECHEKDRLRKVD
jgi:hypothetical protein